MSKLTVLVECKEVSQASFKEKKQLIDMHLAELERLGVTIVNTSLCGKSVGEGIDFPEVLMPDTSKAFSGNEILLLNNGEVIAGQKDMVINASFDDVVTATVTFVIGGFVNGTSD